MTARVVSLLELRQKRRQPALHFTGPVEALEYAVDRVRTHRDQLPDALLTDRDQIDRALGELDALLVACIGSHAAATTNHGETR